MAKAGGDLPPEERARRSVGRLLGTGFATLLVLGLGLGWAWLGVFILEPGEAAVLLRMGKYADTRTQPGLHFSLPPPIVTRVRIDVDEVRNEDFGFRGKEDADTTLESLQEATMQTRDNNIVRVGFAIQYSIKDAYDALYQVADRGAVVRDAAQAAMREAVGKETVDGVLRERRAALTDEAHRLLQEILDSYGAGLDIRSVQLQNVQPPAPVREAFADVLKANQDASRLVNEAEGYRNSLIPNARAEATELAEAALGYRDATIALATGEARRFQALAGEYRKAPEITARRMHIETMEFVLGGVEKVIVDPGSAGLLPYLPLDLRGRGQP